MVVKGGQTPEGFDAPMNGYTITKLIKTEQIKVQTFYRETVTVTKTVQYGGMAQSQQTGSSSAKGTSTSTTSASAQVTVTKDGRSVTKADAAPSSTKDDRSVTKADAATSSGVKEGHSLSLIRKLFGDDLACLCGCLNHLLSGSSLATPYLPLKEDNVFDKLQDGVILCATVIAMPGGSLDESQVHRGSDLKDAELGELRCLQNLNLALKSLEPLGVFTEAVEGRDFRSGRPLLISGILLQIVRVNTHRRIRCEYNRNLIYIMDDWSSDDATKQLDAMSQDEVLTRWVNYQLRKAGTDLVLTNFGCSLADSVIYSTLLNTVAPANKKSLLRSMDDIMVVKDLVLRATYVVKNAEILGISDVITPEHIATAGKGAAMQSARNCVITVAFLGRIFASYPNIDVPAQAAQQSAKGPNSDPKKEPKSKSSNRGASEETLMMWLNSFGVNPIVYNLETDLCSGIVLQQVWKAMAPSYTNWGKFHEVNDPNVSKRKFQWLANCTAVMECAKQHGIQVNCSASDIATGETKNSQALEFLMMRLHSQIRRRRVCGDSVGDLDDGALVKWTNKRLMEFGSFLWLRGLRDDCLVSTNILSFLGERVLVEAGRFRNVSTSTQSDGGGGVGGNSLPVAKTAPAPRRTSVGSSNSEGRTQSDGAPMDNGSSGPRAWKQQQGKKTSSRSERSSSFSSSDESGAADNAPPPQSLARPRDHRQGSMSLSSEADELGAGAQVVNPNAAASVGATTTWLFDSLLNLPEKYDELQKYSKTAITMFRRSGVSVLARGLTPTTDTAVYRDVLLQLNAFAYSA